MSAVERALSLLNAGFSVIPVGANKRPALKTWDPYKTQRMSEAEARKRFQGEVGFALICGSLSELEVIDFDDRPSFDEWYRMAVEDGVLPEDAPIIKTPKGYHLYLKRLKPPGNQKLAKGERDGTVKALIETRGERGYVVAPGSPPRCHPEGGQWEQKAGTDITEWETVKPVADPDYQAMIALARSLNEIPDGIQLQLGAPVQKPYKGGGLSPGADYNERATWSEILEPKGWVLVRENGKVQFWRRPGKEKGSPSATTGFCSNGEKDLFYCFSTNPPPGIESERPYDKFGVYTRTCHDGDFSAAAKRLLARGYGEGLPTQNPHELAAELKSIIERATEAGFDKAAKEAKDALEGLQPELEAAPDSSDLDRDAALQELRRLLGVPVRRIIQNRYQMAQYFLEIEEEEGKRPELLQIGNVDAIRSAAKVEAKLFERFRVEIPQKTKSKGGWKRVRALLARLVEVDDVTFRFSETIREKVMDFVTGTRIFEGDDEHHGWKAGALNRDPFVRDEKLWIRPDEFLLWLARKHQQGMAEGDLHTQLRAAGFRSEIIQFREPKYHRLRWWGIRIDDEIREHLDALSRKGGAKIRRVGGDG